ncbi:MAG: hypothetical protein IPP69_17500 [Flavobacteriales bacterium]|nr:hypothetical protein [Flavobacteriales bacterium]
MPHKKQISALNDDNKYLVKGFMKYAIGAGVSDVIVRAYERDLRRFNVLLQQHLKEREL